MNKKQRIELRDKLIERFSDLVFEEETHFYGLKSDRDFRFKLSCSSISKLCKKEFDTEYWSKKKSKELGKTQDEIKAEWNEKKEVSILRGTAIHLALENLILGKDIENDVFIDNELVPVKTLIAIKDWLIHGGYKFVVPELRMYDKELAISGTMDLLAYNKFTKKYYIIDWKTNRHKPIVKIETYIDKKTGLEKYSNFKFEKPFDTIPQSKYYEYSMQLSTYKLILERNFDIKIEGIILVQISDVLYPDGFKVIDGQIMEVNKLFGI